MRKTWLVPVPMVLALVGETSFAAQHNVSTAEIVAEIQDHLYHAHIFKHGQVQVSYQDGVATLTGTVDSLGVKLDAEHAARKVEDVNQVVDHITVHAEDVTPRQIAEQARKEIVTYPFYTIFDNIVLEAQGDKLIVSGQVSQPYKKEDIGRFLAHVKGVAELENNLEVLPTSTYDDELRIAIELHKGVDKDLDEAASLPIPLLRQLITIKLREGNVINEHYKYVDGTSFAAPIVSSIVACMLEASPRLTPPQIKRILIDTAERVHDIEVDRQGWGVVNARRAVELAIRQ